MYDFYYYFLFVYIVVVGAVLSWFIFHLYKEKHLAMIHKKVNLNKDDL